MKVSHAAILLALLGLVSCSPVSLVPVVSDFNGDSVKLQAYAYAVATDPEGSKKMDAEAARICKTGSKKRAELASSRELPNYITEYLYLCLN